MTMFSKTILGKILGGVAKVATVAAPILLPVAGVAIGASTGLFSKIGSIFKKKAPGAGTVLGNFVTDTASKVADAAGTVLADQIGSTAHGIVDNIVSNGTGSKNPLIAAATKGAKSGAISGWLKKNVGLVIVGAIGLVFIFSVIFRKK